jgi:hypothetical protein
VIDFFPTSHIVEPGLRLAPEAGWGPVRYLLSGPHRVSPKEKIP